MSNECANCESELCPGMVLYQCEECKRDCCSECSEDWGTMSVICQDCNDSLPGTLAALRQQLAQAKTKLDSLLEGCEKLAHWIEVLNDPTWSASSKAIAARKLQDAAGALIEKARKGEAS